MKRFLLACLTTLLSLATWAYDFEEDDIYYNKLTDTTVEVTYKSTSYKSYTMDELIIPETVIHEGTEYTVTAIGYEAFDSSTFSSISMPETITSIGQYAFWKVEKITELTIPNSVTSMGTNTFYGCTGLTTVIIGDGLETLSNSAFQGCTGITSVTFGKSLKVIGSSAFSNCTSLAEITFPETIIEIDDQAFNTCPHLLKITSLNPAPPTCKYSTFYSSLYSSATVYVPAGKKETYEAADGWEYFKNIEELEEDVNEGTPLADGDTFEYDGIIYKVVSAEDQTVEVTYFGELYSDDDAIAYYTGDITIPASFEYMDATYTVIGVGDYAFYKSGVSSISFTTPSNVTYLGTCAMYNCTVITELTLPEGITAVGEYAFSNCAELLTVSVPDEVTTLGAYTFAACPKLESCVLPESMTEVDGYLFYNCPSLTEVTIGSKVESFGASVFAGCPALTAIYSLNPTPPSAPSSTFADTTVKTGTTDKETCVLYIPVGSYDDYSTADEWKDFFNIVEMTEFVIETLEATDITDSSATLNGSVTAAYNDPITEKGFEYWTGDEEVLKAVVEGDEMTAIVTDLTYDTQYTYRAYAIVENGITEYGEELTFTTSVPEGISNIYVDDDNVEAIYSMGGQQISTPQKGVNIVRYSDGTSKKVLMK